MRPSLLSFSLLSLASLAGAAPIMVTTAADSGPGSLRAAFATALIQAGADDIQFAASLNGQTITCTAGNIPTGVQQVTVDSTGLTSGITLRGAGSILLVPAGAEVHLKGLTLTGGSGASGGAVHNAGTMTLTGCTLHDNTVSGGGGAVHNLGTMSLTQCTLTRNASTGLTGGAIQNEGTMTLTHCTVAANSAPAGGGIANTSSLTLTNCIVAGNTSPGAGADLHNGGTATWVGSNLKQAAANYGAGTSSGPSITAPARLQPLGYYGGQAPTMPPRADSPALDRISSTPLSTDQRGLPRVMWGAADIGAVEAGTQADCAWEVREFFRSPASPLNSLADALTLVADPAAQVLVSTPPVINRSDPGFPGTAGFYPDDDAILTDNLTPQGLLNGDDNDFATVARTFITIATEADYTFGFSGSEGARLRVFGAAFLSSTRLNPSNPANPAHSGDTLSFPGLTDNSVTLGVCHLLPGVYPVELVTWERSGGASAEVFVARGVHTSVGAAFRLAGDVSAGGSFTAGALTELALPETWLEQFSNDDGGFLVSNPRGAFEGPWLLNDTNGTWDTAGQVSEGSTAPTSLLTSPPIIMKCSGDAILRFAHRFSFESDANGNWDGGQVRLSVNGGPFNTVAGSAFTQNGYTGTVAPQSVAELQGQTGFVFDSFGYAADPPLYVTSVARLGTFNAGDSLRVQFMASFDQNRGRGNPAWELDQVSLEQQCAGFEPGWEVTTIRNAAGSMSEALTQMFAHWAGQPQPNATDTLAVTINLRDPQATGGGHGQTQSPFPGDSDGDDDYFALGARATLNVPVGDDYTFCLLADDTARLRIRGSRWWTVTGAGSPLTLVDGFQSENGVDTFGQVRLTAGAHTLELVCHEGTGSAYAGLWAARGSHSSFNPEIFTLVGGPGIIRAQPPLVLTRQTGLTRPANDDFAAASVLNGCATACTAGATLESPEAGGPAMGSTLWWVWTAPAAGTYVFDTAGSDFDTLLAVYPGNTVPPAAAIASNDNYGAAAAARLTVQAAQGAGLYIQAGGAGGATGRLKLQVYRTSTQANDAFASARALGSPYSIGATGQNDAATAEAGEPAHVSGHAATGSVWFTWTAPATGGYRIDTRGSALDTLLAVYTGSTLPGLTKVASNDDLSALVKQSSVDLSATIGTTYRIAVDGRDAAARGDWRLNITHLASVTAHALIPGVPRAFRMTWSSEPWTTYRVEQSTNLSGWLRVTDGLHSAGESTILQINGLSPATLRQYFRVRRE